MASKPAARVKRVWPWDPVELSVQELSSIKAMAASHAVGFNAVLQTICGIDRISFAAGAEDGRRATDFAEGMRFVGNQLRKVRDMKMPAPQQQAQGPHAVPTGEPPKN